MDTRLDSNRTIIERVLTDYSKYPYSYGDIQRQIVFDRTGDHYLLLSVGWDKRRVHGCLIHIDLINGVDPRRSPNPLRGLRAQGLESSSVRVLSATPT